MHAQSHPTELVITNMTRRVMLVIEEEYNSALQVFLHEADHPSSSGHPSPPTSSVPPTPALGIESGGIGSFFTERDLATAPNGVSGSLGSMFDLLGHKPVASSSTGIQPPQSNTSSAFNTPQPLSTLSSPTSSAQTSPSSSGILPPRPTLPLRTPSLQSPHVKALLEDEFNRNSYKLKSYFQGELTDMYDEIDGTYKSVGEQAVEHIHNG